MNEFKREEYFNNFEICTYLIKNTLNIYCLFSYFINFYEIMIMFTMIYKLIYH